MLFHETLGANVQENEGVCPGDNTHRWLAVLGLGMFSFSTKTIKGQGETSTKRKLVASQFIYGKTRQPFQKTKLAQIRRSSTLRLDFSNYELMRCNSKKSKNLKKIHSIALGELLLKI